MRRLLIGIVVALTSSSAFAQEASPATAAPLAVLEMLRTTSQRLDALQQRLDQALVPDANQYAWAHVDGVIQTEPNVVMVLGWGFGCGYDESRVVVVIDGIELSNKPHAIHRADVTAGNTWRCWNVPTLNAIEALVDMTVFEPGFLSNHVHTAQIRVYPPAYVGLRYPFPMTKSDNTFTFRLRDNE